MSNNLVFGETSFVRYCPQGDLNIAFRHTAWYQAAGWSKQGW
ncbi:MAG: hypothetical protein ACFNP8_01525 [Alloprevotella sp.]